MCLYTKSMCHGEEVKSTEKQWGREEIGVDGDGPWGETENGVRKYITYLASPCILSSIVS